MEKRYLTVVAQIKVRPGQEQKVKEALLALVEPTRQEPGCVQYDLHQSLENPEHFLFYEHWRSRQDLDEHLQKPHIQEFLRHNEALLAEPLALSFWQVISEPAGH
ncbi:MAG: putative quinol monooxygenase [Desulfobacca sp.]|uniref:putative quinol monooxygenase n=1 Tax=Desulfobacca sp. TaxID=2067990 RepID=UPI00404B5559